MLQSGVLEMLERCAGISPGFAGDSLFDSNKAIIALPMFLGH